MLQKLLLTAIAVLTALPALALPSYTSSAPNPSNYTDFDTTPVLIQDNEEGQIFASREFVSVLGNDGNIYINRIFARNFTDNGHNFIVAKYTQIDCGRGLTRSLGGSGAIDGMQMPVDSSGWTGFRIDSPIAKTCEQAARDRGIDWSWGTR